MADKVKAAGITPEEYAKIQLSTLMDDEFMTEFFRDNIPAVQLVLRIIMSKDDLIVKRSRVQQFISGKKKYHSVRLDVYAVDSEGRQYDIEVQNASQGASPYRARYNSAIIDVNTLKPREKYAVLRERENVVIFITKKDVLKGGLPIYTIQRTITQTGKPFDDGTYIIYVNSSMQDTETDIGKLMHDFSCPDTGKMYYSRIADDAEKLKKGERIMGVWKNMKRAATAKGRAEGEAKGKAEGRAEGKAEGKAEGRAEGILVGIAQAYKNMAVDLLHLGTMTLEQIADLCKMSLSQVQELAATIK